MLANTAKSQWQLVLKNGGCPLKVPIIQLHLLCPFLFQEMSWVYRISVKQRIPSMYNPEARLGQHVL